MDSQNKNTHQDYSQLGLEKFQLENEKLKLEISDLKKNPFKKSSFWTSFFPVIIAIIVAAYGFYTGFFDRQRQLNEIESKTLAYQADTLQDFIKRNNKINDSLVVQIKTLQDSIAYLKDIENSIKKKYTFHEERELTKTELIKAVDGFLDSFNKVVNTYEKTEDSIETLPRHNNDDWDKAEQLENTNSQYIVGTFIYKFQAPSIEYRKKLLTFLPRYVPENDKKLWEQSAEAPFWNNDYEHPTNPLGVKSVFENLNSLLASIKIKK